MLAQRGEQFVASHTVYELARTKLLMLAWEQKPRISVLELRRLMLSFETAIEQVEIHASRRVLS
jgi:hypothetical protein